jgi:hypothetical protein
MPMALSESFKDLCAVAPKPAQASKLGGQQKRSTGAELLNDKPFGVKVSCRIVGDEISCPKPIPTLVD